MGRPKLHSLKRDSRITVFFTADEHRAVVFAAQSAGIEAPDFLLQSALNICVVARAAPPPPINLQTLITVNRISVNLNQIAAILHRSNVVGASVYKDCDNDFYDIPNNASFDRDSSLSSIAQTIENLTPVLAQIRRELIGSKAEE